MPKPLLPTEFKAACASLGYPDIKNLGHNAFGVVVPKTKVAGVVPALNSAFEEYKPKVISDVEIRIGTLAVFAKNANLQRTRQAFTMGRGNEFNLMAAIDEYRVDYGKPITIEFVERNGGRKFVCKEVAKAEHVGAKNIFQRNKADVQLVTATMKVFPLSIKDVNAGAWESADTYWGEKSKQFLMWALDQKVTKLEKKGNIYSIKPTIAIAASDKEIRDVVFGADIYGKGAVIVEKFNANSFVWDYTRDTLVISCKNVILTEADVRGGYEVYFRIRNDSTRNPQFLHPGLRTLATMKDQLLGEVKVFGRSTRAEVGI